LIEISFRRFKAQKNPPTSSTGQTTSETTSSTGSIKQDKKEFKEERIIRQTTSTRSRIIAELKKEGWTINDWEIASGDWNLFHVGR
jgi:hypothetical protein